MLKNRREAKFCCVTEPTRKSSKSFKLANSPNLLLIPFGRASIMVHISNCFRYQSYLGLKKGKFYIIQNVHNKSENKHGRWTFRTNLWNALKGYKRKDIINNIVLDTLQIKKIKDRIVSTGMSDRRSVNKNDLTNLSLLFKICVK